MAVQTLRFNDEERQRASPGEQNNKRIKMFKE